MNKKDLQIDPEFHGLIPPLSDDERAQLEASILTEGCRDAVVAWGKLLVDGHNRLEICSRHRIKVAVIRINFLNRDEAKAWIIRNQLGRRNLSDFQKAELALKLKPTVEEKAQERMKSGRADPVQKSAQGRTRDEIAEAAGVSHDTISKVESINKNGVPKLQTLARSGAVSINAAAEVAKLPAKEQKEIADKGADEVREVARSRRIVIDEPASDFDGDDTPLNSPLPADYAKAQPHVRWGKMIQTMLGIANGMRTSGGAAKIMAKWPEGQRRSAIQQIQSVINLLQASIEDVEHANA